MSAIFQRTSGGLVAMERCPLCRATRRSYTCKQCINQGNFQLKLASSRLPADRKGTRYLDKKTRYNIFLVRKNEILQQLEPILTEEKQKDAMRWRLKQQKCVLAILQDGLDKQEKDLEREQHGLNKLSEENLKRKQQTKRHNDKIQKMLKSVEQVKLHYDKQSLLLLDRSHNLQRERQMNVRELIAYIFPLDELSNMSSEHESNESDTSTSCDSHNQWEYTTDATNTEPMCTILNTSLPANGDYSTCISFHETNKTISTNPDVAVPLINPAYNVAAALCFTTQLLSLLSYFLDIRLPKRLCYSKFTSGEFSRAIFNKSVATLNTNILYLCCSQNVDPDMLYPSRTLPNIMLCVNPDTSELGRTGSFEMSNQLMRSIEESFQSLYADCDLNDLSEGENGESNSTPGEATTQEWEALPSSQSLYIPPDELEAITESSRAKVSGGATAASGLVSSAAASVASLWRAATGHKME